KMEAAGGRGHRCGSRDHHPEPGSLLAVRHGRSDVPVLRGLDPGGPPAEEVTSTVRRGRAGQWSARSRRRRWPAFVVVAAVVAVTAGAVYAVAPKGGGGPDPKAWDRKASAAFRGLVSDVPELAKGAREWLAGERTT